MQLEPFYPLVDTSAEIIGVEAAGKGLKSKITFCNIICRK
jgi:hypothetical protein